MLSLKVGAQIMKSFGQVIAVGTVGTGLHHSRGRSDHNDTVLFHFPSDVVDGSRVSALDLGQVEFLFTMLSLKVREQNMKSFGPVLAVGPCILVQMSL